MRLNPDLFHSTTSDFLEFHHATDSTVQELFLVRFEEVLS